VNVRKKEVCSMIMEYFTAQAMEEINLDNSPSSYINIFYGSIVAMDVIIVNLPTKLNLVPDMYDRACSRDFSSHGMGMLLDPFEMRVL
jgi:hypothetical protein